MPINVMPAANAASIHDQLSSAYNIRANAISDGGKNHPAWDAVEPSLTEQKIISEISQAWESASGIASRRRHDAEEKMNAARAKIGAYISPVDPEHALADVKDLFSQHEIDQNYTNFYRDLKREEASYNVFRAENHLTHRQAHYPESRLLGISIIVLVCFVEAILNSYLFAKGSDFGLLGGVMQALMVSVVNAGALAFVFGYVALPRTNHIKTKIKTIGFVLCAVTLLLVLTFNLAVGHYRGELIAGSAQPAKDALNSFVSSPTNLGDLEAWLLFLLGLSAFALAVYKFYTLDDPYPGYGYVDKRFKEANRQLIENFNEIRSKAQSHLDRSTRMVDQKFDDLRSQVEQFGQAIPEAKAAFGALKQDAKALELALSLALAQYRDVNRSVRVVDPPKYWSDDSLSRKYFELAEQMEAEELARYEELQQEYEGLKESVNGARGSLTSTRSLLKSEGTLAISSGLEFMRKGLEAKFYQDQASQNAPRTMPTGMRNG